jgi:undecaprenol kinase
MDSRDKNRNEWSRLYKSFNYAINGITNAFKKERNFQIHVFISFVVVLLGFYFQITKLEWLIIIITIGVMLTLELMNTAVERVVDLVTKDYHPLAKLAKDTSAGAVFTFAITAVIVGVLIFVDYFKAMF